MFTAQEIKDNREAWLAALRSGRYQQTQGYLQNEEGFCCLGVACDISGLGRWRNEYPGPLGRKSYDISGDYSFSSVALLPPPVREHLGLQQTSWHHVEFIDRVTHMNDAGKTFEQIATRAESYFAREK